MPATIRPSCGDLEPLDETNLKPLRLVYKPQLWQCFFFNFAILMKVPVWVKNFLRWKVDFMASAYIIGWVMSEADTAINIDYVRWVLH